jgi:zinc transporter 2
MASKESLSVKLLDGAGMSAPAPAPTTMSAKKASARQQLLKIMGICLVFMACEVVGGYLAGSLAIMTDAAHLLSDAASFAISLTAVWLAERPRTARATFGFHRLEIFGAMASVLLIWVLTAALCFEAVQRIIEPEPVDGKIMFITAAGGLGVNLLMMRVLHGGGAHGHSHGGGGGGHGHSHGPTPKGAADTNYSVQAAYIHILGDFVQSIGVLIAAVIIWARPEWHLADPICTFLFSVLVLFTTFNIMSSAYSTLLNSVPESVELPRLAADLLALPSVVNVHDLHVWSFGQDRTALTAHLIVRGTEAERSAALSAAGDLANKAGIFHCTLQVELEASGDVDTCLRHNEHVDECSLTLQDPDTRLVSLFVIERPLAHTSSARRETLKAALADGASASCGHDHGHDHGHNHGHDHGGNDHGHSHR